MSHIERQKMENMEKRLKSLEDRVESLKCLFGIPKCDKRENKALEFYFCIQIYGILINFSAIVKRHELYNLGICMCFKNTEYDFFKTYSVTSLQDQKFKQRLTLFLVV